jgi:hypothetical protein
VPQSPAAGAPTTYLQVVGDGDPHTVIRPDTMPPRTPTETLQQIIARDEAPVSASSCCANSTTRSAPGPGQPPRSRRRLAIRRRC